MADNYLDFTIRVKDKGSEVLRTIGVSADDLNKGIRAVKEETDRLNSKIVNAAQLGQIFDSVQQSMAQLMSVCHDLTRAYQVQLVAETQLQTVMRQRMSATDEEIQSIKALCSAQQELGVIGDEVQLSGAQQIATFVSQKTSLESLIPAMNNLLAQQKGLNATNQDAVGIGNMMGKAMQGQVDVLQRVGVTFTDAQKKVLQYGSESERAAMLAQVIRDNVGEMNAELARTDAGKQKQLENTLGDIKEKLGGMVQGAMPFLSIAAAATTASAGTLRLVTSVKALTIGINKNTATVLANTIQTRVQSQARMLLTAATGTATLSTKALTTATVALYAAYTMGISLAIYAVCQALFGVSEAAGQATGKQDLLKESADAYISSASQAKAGIDMEVSALASLIKSHGDEAGKVGELNRKYGEALGYHKTAAEWYDVLIRKSGDYCKAIGYEAQAKVLASQKAAKELELEAVRSQKQALEKSGKNKTEVTSVRSGPAASVVSYKVNTKEYDSLIEQERTLTDETAQLQQQFDTCMEKVAEGASALNTGSKTVDVAAMSYEQLGKEIESTEARLKGLAPTETAEINRLTAYNKQLKTRKAAMAKQLGLGDGGRKGEDVTVAVNPENYKELSDVIGYYEKQLQKTKPTETQAISLLTEKINKYKEQQQAIADQLAAAGRPKELDTLENIDKELTYQKSLRSRCTQENLAGIDAEIERLNSLRTAFEEQSHVSKSLDQIQTYRQLADELSFYETKIKTATETERVEIQKQINALNELRDAWDRQLDGVKRPDDISQLNTIEKLSEAVSYYEGVQRTQSAQEIEATQRVINALNEKKAAMERLTQIPQMQADTERLDGLGNKELKLELKLIGLDGIKAKIRDLQKMLSDTKNPLDDEQRSEVTKLVASYQEYEKILGKSTLKATEAWGAVKGISNGMQGLTDTLQGNGSAWEKVVSIIDGAIQLYEGFSAIIPIIDTLTGASTKHAAAKGVEAVAETTEAGTNATAAATAVAASAATAAALSVETAAWSALSAAKTFSAHAYIPFAGTAIAAGFIAAQQAIITAAAIPKFANGGIAYGPTLGLFGEYAGASSNPEVVAPLNRLKQLIQPIGGIGGGTVEFKIDGRTLKGVLNKVDNFNSRTR